MVLWKDLSQGTEDEVAEVHEGMGDGEFWCGEMKVAVEEDVNVDGAVGVGGEGGGCREGGGNGRADAYIECLVCLLGATEEVLNGLCLVEELLRSEGGLEAHGGVEEGMG